MAGFCGILGAKHLKYHKIPAFTPLPEQFLIYNTDMSESPVFERIYAIIRQVPPGQVVTYGQVAKLVGRISAQMVGFALSALRERSGIEPVPWQRVINAQGKISPHGLGFGTAVQRQLLEEEGVVFDVEGRIDLSLYRWNVQA